MPHHVGLEASLLCKPQEKKIDEDYVQIERRLRIAGVKDTVTMLERHP